MHQKCETHNLAKKVNGSLSPPKSNLKSYVEQLLDELMSLKFGNVFTDVATIDSLTTLTDRYVKICIHQTSNS